MNVNVVCIPRYVSSDFNLRIEFGSIGFGMLNCTKNNLLFLWWTSAFFLSFAFRMYIFADHCKTDNDDDVNSNQTAKHTRYKMILFLNLHFRWQLCVFSCVAKTRLVVGTAQIFGTETQENAPTKIMK